MSLHSFVNCGIAFLLGACSITAVAMQEQGVIRIVIIGDSHVANFDPAKSELRGWGQMLPDCLKHPDVQVANLALSGRSSKSFLKEGHWDNVLKLSPAPNYVLIQFGGNDVTGKGPLRETLPGEVPAQLPKKGLGSDFADWYRNNIRTYIEQTRKIGAIPVIVTPIERRHPKTTVSRNNLPWAQAAIAVAREMNVPCIDLNNYSVAVYQKFGYDGSSFMHARKNDGSYDVHFLEVGARIWAEFIADQLGQSVPTLKPMIVLPRDRTIDKKQ